MNGHRRFKHCQVEQIKSMPVLSQGAGRKVIVLGEETNVIREVLGYEAKLDCPRTQDEGLVVETSKIHDTNATALREVAQRAGEFACQGCAYALMSPAQVSEARAARTQAEVERLRVSVELHDLREQTAQWTAPAILPAFDKGSAP